MISEAPTRLFAEGREFRQFTGDLCRQVSPRDSRSSADSRIRKVPVSILGKLHADGILDEIRPASGRQPAILAFAALMEVLA